MGCTGAGKHAIEEVLNPFRPVLDTFRLQTNIIDRLVHFRGIVCMVGGDEGGEGHMHVFVAVERIIKRAICADNRPPCVQRKLAE